MSRRYYSEPAAYLGNERIRETTTDHGGSLTYLLLSLLSISERVGLCLSTATGPSNSSLGSSRLFVFHLLL
ncbi:uncharacterized protein LACBIDRAFT_303805 [Laccaria bicolor S238N-H82]|uniref:Predicted protein n=1 Tax=Laccaria bicolor (strain S238N-H82 / ATCC MYA-4686) TaxID=486041 RepID=B0DKD2_LACBS|nr:uncharacterized protein LACBIDRAFT_303805 [Laccaria bicolor S238N-H82]EDR05047.1 predicted protein [Laccaria bicolor S238N-H82]|eukprot:XP_001884437.1 predicted protein [Laccaria bicolor S238N-H82]